MPPKHGVVNGKVCGIENMPLFSRGLCVFLCRKWAFFAHHGAWPSRHTCFSWANCACEYLTPRTSVIGHFGAVCRRTRSVRKLCLFSFLHLFSWFLWSYSMTNGTWVPTDLVWHRRWRAGVSFSVGSFVQPSTLVISPERLRRRVVVVIVIIHCYCW